MAFRQAVFLKGIFCCLSRLFPLGIQSSQKADDHPKRYHLLFSTPHTEDGVEPVPDQ